MRPRRRAGRARGPVLVALLLVGCLLASCANPPRASGPAGAHPERWSGRLAVLVASDPPQQFHAGFDLAGTPQVGQLDLTSPLGSTLAVLQWAPGQALLRHGDQVLHYDSLGALATAATGTDVPVRALFAWLHGTPERVAGWQADLSQLQQGRVTARRDAPPPAAELRVILDRD